MSTPRSSSSAIISTLNQQNQAFSDLSAKMIHFLENLIPCEGHRILIGSEVLICLQKLADKLAIYDKIHGSNVSEMIADISIDFCNGVFNYYLNHSLTLNKLTSRATNARSSINRARADYELRMMQDEFNPFLIRNRIEKIMHQAWARTKYYVPAEAFVQTSYQIIKESGLKLILNEDLYKKYLHELFVILTTETNENITLATVNQSRIMSDTIGILITHLYWRCSLHSKSKFIDLSEFKKIIIPCALTAVKMTEDFATLNVDLYQLLKNSSYSYKSLTDLLRDETEHHNTLNHQIHVAEETLELIYQHLHCCLDEPSARLQLPTHPVYLEREKKRASALASSAAQKVESTIALKWYF